MPQWRRRVGRLRRQPSPQKSRCTGRTLRGAQGTLTLRTVRERDFTSEAAGTPPTRAEHHVGKDALTVRFGLGCDEAVFKRDQRLIARIGWASVDVPARKQSGPTYGRTGLRSAGCSLSALLVVSRRRVTRRVEGRILRLTFTLAVGLLPRCLLTAVVYTGPGCDLGRRHTSGGDNSSDGHRCREKRGNASASHVVSFQALVLSSRASSASPPGTARISGALPRSCRCSFRSPACTAQEAVPQRATTSR
jgi:hypothetical protein